MDKNSIIGLSLIAVILIAWLSLSGPSKEQIARNKYIKDSIELVTKTNLLSEQKLVAQKEKVLPVNIQTIPDSVIEVKNKGFYKNFAISAEGKSEIVTIENENIKAFISTKGGYVQKVELKNYQRYGKKERLVLFNQDSTFQSLKFEAFKGTNLETDSFYFKPSAISLFANKAETKSLTLKLETDSPGSYIEYTYSLKGNDYILGYDIRFEGMQNIITSNKVVLNWTQKLPSQEQHIAKEREVATAYYKQINEDVDYINARKSEQKDFTETNIKWVCFKQHFFNSSLIANSEFLKEGSFIKTFENIKDSVHVKTIITQLGIPFKKNSSEIFSMKYYFGPNHYNTLNNYNLDLEDIIPTGWSIFSYINKWMVIPLFSLLSSLNAGIIILILTLILKTFLFPIAYKTYMSSSKMRVLKPEIDALNEKYGADADPMKKQQESMALYRRAGANPLSGCLPMLLQFPILIALFNFFPASIELRQKSFLWADDLSTYDSVYNFGFEVWGFGDHISLFAMLMFVSTIIYTWMNQAILQPQQTTQMPGMKYMMYFMPVIFLAVMNSYAAGLSWYYFLANIITFLQTWLMKKWIDDSKIREELLANMKKPEKKSGFQAKLEEISKQQQLKSKNK